MSLNVYHIKYSNLEKKSFYSKFNTSKKIFHYKTNSDPSKIAIHVWSISVDGFGIIDILVQVGNSLIYLLSYTYMYPNSIYLHSQSSIV